MASIRFIGPVSLLSNGAMTGVAKISSGIMDMLALPFGAFEAIWTGTPTGAFSIDGSIDGLSWYPTGTPVNNPAGSAGSTLINLSGIGFRYSRLSYTNSGGTGSLSINGFAKSGGC